MPLPKTPQSPVGGELCAEMPPYDVFAADIDKKDRTEHFFAVSKWCFSLIISYQWHEWYVINLKLVNIFIRASVALTFISSSI